MSIAKFRLLSFIIIGVFFSFLLPMEETEDGSQNTLSQLLFAAIKNGDQSTINAHRKQISDASIILDGQNRTLLQAALDDKQFAMATVLLENFLLPHQLAPWHRDLQGRSALDIAVGVQHLPSINSILNKFARYKDFKQLVAASIKRLICSAAKTTTFTIKDQNILEKLLEYLKPKTLNDIRDTEGNSLLHLAAGSDYDNYQLVEFLLRQGMNPALVNPRNQVALDIATQSRNEQSAGALREHSQETQSLNAAEISAEEMTPEMLAYQLFTALRKRDLALLKSGIVLLQEYPNLCVKNKARQTLLLVALDTKNPLAAQMLIEQLTVRQLAPFEPDCNGVTAHALALKNKTSTISTTLLKQLKNHSAVDSPSPKQSARHRKKNTKPPGVNRDSAPAVQRPNLTTPPSIGISSDEYNVSWRLLLMYVPQHELELFLPDISQS